MAAQGCADPKLFELVLNTALEFKLEFKLKSKRQMFGGERDEKIKMNYEDINNGSGELKNEKIHDTEVYGDSVVDFDSCEEAAVKEKGKKRRRIETSPKRGDIVCSGCNTVFSARSNLGRHWKVSYERNPEGPCAKNYSRKKSDF